MVLAMYPKNLIFTLSVQKAVRTTIYFIIVVPAALRFSISSEKSLGFWYFFLPFPFFFLSFFGYCFVDC